MKAVMSKVHTSWPVSVGWTVLSVVTASVLIACYNGPAWYHTRRRTIRDDDDPSDDPSVADVDDGAVTFGLASYCRRSTCTSYGDSVETQFAYIPDPWWKVAYVLFGSGSVFFGYSAVCALICQLLPNVNLRKSVAHYTGYVQAVGGQFQFVFHCGTFRLKSSQIESHHITINRFNQFHFS